jgi:hypothetical protein
MVRLRTVDAFAEGPFTGSPAAVLVLDDAPSDEWSGGAPSGDDATGFDGALSETAERDAGLPPAEMEDTLQS